MINYCWSGLLLKFTFL